MSSRFTTEEKRRWLLKKHIKNHLFEYALDLIGPVVIAVLLLYICKAEDILLGAVLAFFFALGRVVYDIVHYKKEYVDLSIKDEADKTE